jgi:predicted exporter
VTILAAGGAAGVWGIRTDTDFRRLRPADAGPSRIDDEIAARFGIGELDGTVVSEGPTAEAALQDAERVVRLLDRYREEGLVRGVESPTALVPSLATQQRRWRQWEALPRAQAATALREALAAAGFRVEAFAGALHTLERGAPAFVEPAGSADALPAPLAAIAELHLREDDGLVSAATFVRTGGRLPDLAARLRADLDAQGSPGWVSGRALMEADLGRILRREIWLFTALGLLANVAIVWTSFRNVRTTVAVLLPPTAALGAFLIGARTLDVALTPITVVVLPLMLGIGVDNCVYLAERHRQDAPLEDIGTLGGRAVVMSSLTTILGFGFLATSRFPGLAQLGALAAASIALGLVASLTLLPACLSGLRVPAPHRLATDRAVE